MAELPVNFGINDPSYKENTGLHSLVQPCDITKAIPIIYIL